MTTLATSVSRLPVGAADGHRPGLRVLVVDGALDLGREADVRAQLEAVGDVLEVVVQLVAQREVLRPVVGRERERVEVVRRVDPGARVVVVPPGAAHRLVLLDDREGDAQLLEVHGRADARDAAADDQHPEALRHVEAALVLVGEVQAELRRHHVAVLAGHRFAHGARQHLDEQLGRGLGDRHGPAGPPGQDGLERGLPDLLLDVLGEAGVVVVAHAAAARRPVGRLQPAVLAGHLEQHHQQRRDVGDRHRLGERLGLLSVQRVEFYSHRSPVCGRSGPRMGDGPILRSGGDKVPARAPSVTPFTTISHATADRPEDT